MEIKPIGVLYNQKPGDLEGASTLVVIETGAGEGTGFGEHSHVLLTARVGEDGSARLQTAVAQVLSRDSGRLAVGAVGWPDGTPVLALEGYSPADLGVFSARTGEELRFPAGRDDAAILADLIDEAARFHGERCAGIVLGAKIMLHMMKTWRVGQKDQGLRLWLGSDGCVADALIALSGVTLGTGRLKVPGGRIYRFVRGDKGLAYYPTERAFASASEVIGRQVEDLFAIREEAQRPEERKPSHAQRPPKRSKKEEALVKQVLNSLVDGKLSCAMAYKIADENAVHILDIGKAADEARVKISHCQLGCFH
ncbi:MAG: hypothetical protein HYX94_00685 [Chloroflexi bacterium]|nr:hypothetical protein [Chloroflexota bacterium]